MDRYNISGDKPYHERARAALSILVRQARAQRSIYYENLANELGMPNPRNLNYPLGVIGESLQQLGQDWGIQIPPIQCLVINKATNLPGVGVSWSVQELSNYKRMPLRTKRILIDKFLDDIYIFDRWDEVLDAFGLEQSDSPISEIQLSAARTGAGAPESAAHRLLKEYVAKNPSIVGIRLLSECDIEYSLPSSDVVDVLFKTKKEWVAVEVKAANADIAEITRGIFQCIKYHALVEAVLIVEDRSQVCRAVLVTEAVFPAELNALRNILGIQIVDQVVPS